jgi:hypothetical protein
MQQTNIFCKNPSLLPSNLSDIQSICHKKSSSQIGSKVNAEESNTYESIVFITYDSLLNREPSGVSTAYFNALQEPKINKTRKIVLSFDTLQKSKKKGSVEIFPVSKGLLDKNNYFISVFRRDFRWIMLHNEAYTLKSLKAIFDDSLLISADIKTNQPEFLLDNKDVIKLEERILSTLCNNGITINQCFRYEDEMNKRFLAPLNKIKNLRSVIWHGQSVLPNIRYCAPILSEHTKKIFYLHEYMPSNLSSTKWIDIELLNTILLLDKVYLHCNEFKKRLTVLIDQHSKKRKIDKIPEIRVFSLGIDKKRIKKSKRLFKEHRAIINYCSTECQRHLYREIYTSEHVPHKFLSVDRIHPHKGNHIVLLSFYNYFRELISLGYSLEMIKREYRLFIISSEWKHIKESPIFLHASYNNYISKLIRKFKKEFPGILFNCKAFTGESSIIVPGLMQGATLVSGGIADGLHLASMESIAVNASMKKAVSIILGRGAGFAIQVIEELNAHLAYFPSPGSVEDFFQCIKSVVTLQKSGSGRTVLSENLICLYEKFVKKRNSSLFAS